MNITCCICSELFVPSDDVYFTPCGHFFHFPCVSHWLERSKTCPHCRTKVTDRTIHRAYFNFSNIDSTELDGATLMSKIDSLNLQLSFKDTDLKNCAEENAKLKKQAAGLRAEVKKLELDIEKHRSANYAFKEQAKYWKNQISDSDAAKKEVVRLTKKVQEYRNVEMLITGSQDEIDRMLSETQDKPSLITYICVMKREMESNVQRRKELRERIRRLEREIFEFKSERDNLLQYEAKCRQLEEDLAHSENEKRSLCAKLQELKSKLISKRKTAGEDIHRFIAESPAPQGLKTLSEPESTSDASNSIMTSPDLFATPVKESRAESPELNPESKRKENSPEILPKFKSREKPCPAVKSQGAGSLSQPSSRLTSSGPSLSILSKKPRVLPMKAGGEKKEMYYDGFGGHSKVDDYPSPILSLKQKVLKNNLMSVKTKRRKLGDSSNKKLENYFVDLT